MKSLKNSLFFLLITCLLGLTQLALTPAGLAPELLWQGANEDDAFFAASLCLPDLYMVNPGRCLPSGASQSISKLVESGFPYPLRELTAASPDALLGIIPVSIARINLEDTESAPLYATFADAIANNNPTRFIAPGVLRYVSYINRSDHEGKAYLQLSSGEWLRASPVAYTRFQGMQFTQNPINDFGWIVDQTPSYTAPSFAAPETGRSYYRENKIQIYNTVEAETVFWYEVAPNEWVNSLKARRVHFDPTPPEGIDTDRWISINLFEQTLVIYEGGDLKFVTLLASGMEPFYTQPGIFPIYQKLKLETMQGAFTADRSDFYYLQDVPWTMYFDQARAIHGSYWRTYFGYPQSHGCVNLSPGDANWVFQWAEEGDWVHVYDPSGRTPTDPGYYGPGAP